MLLLIGADFFGFQTTTQFHYYNQMHTLFMAVTLICSRAVKVYNCCLMTYDSNASFFNGDGK